MVVDLGGCNSSFEQNLISAGLMLLLLLLLPWSHSTGEVGGVSSSVVVLVGCGESVGEELEELLVVVVDAVRGGEGGDAVGNKLFESTLSLSSMNKAVFSSFFTTRSLKAASPGVLSISALQPPASVISSSSSSSSSKICVGRVSPGQLMEPGDEQVGLIGTLAVYKSFSIFSTSSVGEVRAGGGHNNSSSLMLLVTAAAPPLLNFVAAADSRSLVVLLLTMAAGFLAVVAVTALAQFEVDFILLEDLLLLFP